MAALSDHHYVIGERYLLIEHEDRSMRSHRHFFACVATAWENLNEEALQEFPTPDALRKRALIRTGYRDERSIVCSTKAEALRVAAFLKPADPLALVVVHENTVTEYKAKSQSLAAMGKEEFAKSKDDVLTYLSNMIGVDVTQLKKAGEQ